MSKRNPTTMPKKFDFILAYNAKRKTWFQVARWDVPGRRNWVIEPWFGIIFKPKYWAPLP